MKLMEENDIINITASTEDSSYPASNMLNDSPKKRWKANTINNQTLDVDVMSGSKGMAFFNISGIESISAISLDAFNMEWGGSTAWGSPTEWGYTANSAISFTVDATDKNMAWVDYDYVIGATTLRLTITSKFGSFPSIGIITSGPVFECEDPQPDWDYSFIDYSIVTELSNGAFDSRDRDVVRIFSGNIFMTTTQFFDFSEKYRDSIKSNPRAWWFASKYFDENYLIYGRLSGTPSASMTSLDGSTKANVSLSITEEI